MSAAPPPPPPVTTPPPAPPATTPETAPKTLTVEQGVGALTGLSVEMGVLAVISLIFVILFHVGAGYLSYQKYGNILWAIVNFFFAYFYYPYYAFFLASDPSPQPAGILGGARKLLKQLRRK